MNDLERLAKELGLGEKGEALRKLGSSAEGRALGSAVDGAALEKAFADGDAAALRRMLGALLATPEGKKLSDDVRKIMEN